MRRSVILLAAFATLAACGGGGGSSGGAGESESGSAVSAANPAAVFCEEQGGVTFGSEPMCGLPDGTTVDAWEYYRAETNGSTATSSRSADAGGQTPDPTSSSSTTSTIPPPDQIGYLEGVGSAVVPVDGTWLTRLQPGVLIAEHDGPGPFRITAVRADGADLGTLADADGVYAGRHTWALPEVDPPTELRIEADGDWRIRIIDGHSPTESQHQLVAAAGAVYAGQGDDVLITGLGELLALHFRCDDCEGAIRVTPYGGETNQSIDLTGDGQPLEESILLYAGTQLIEVEAWDAAAGSWQIELAEAGYELIAELDQSLACQLSNGRDSICPDGGSTPLYLLCESGELPLDECDGFDHPDRSASSSGSGQVCPSYRYQEYEPYSLCTRGPGVEGLQQALKYFGYLSGSVDGYFGPGTEAAVRAAQRDYGVPADGIAEGMWYRDLIETYYLSR